MAVACVRVSLRPRTGRLPILVDGNPQRGVLAADEHKLFMVWTSPGHDTLSITLSADFGDPDLFVTATPQ